MARLSLWIFVITMVVLVAQSMADELSCTRCIKNQPQPGDSDHEKCMKIKKIVDCLGGQDCGRLQEGVDRLIKVSKDIGCGASAVTVQFGVLALCLVALKFSNMF